MNEGFGQHRTEIYVMATEDITKVITLRVNSEVHGVVDNFTPWKRYIICLDGRVTVWRTDDLGTFHDLDNNGWLEIKAGDKWVKLTDLKLLKNRRRFFRKPLTPMRILG